MSQRSVLLIALVLATVTLVVQARVLVGGKTWDDVRYHTQVAPPRYAAATAVQEGSLPTWWEGTGFGVPLLGEPSHGAAYPLHWIAGTPRSLELLLILHLLIAALGTALWARKLGASEVAAVVCGILVTTTGVIATSLVRGYAPALAWLPWIGWAALARRPSLVGGFVALVGLAGDLGILIDAIVLAALLVDRSQRGRGAIAVACGLAIASIQWIPAALALPHLAGSGMHGIKIARFLEIAVPMRSLDEHFPTIFIGAPLLALALAGATKLQRRVLVLVVLLAIASAFSGQHLAVLAVIAAAHAGSSIDALFAADTERVLGARRRALLALGGAALLTAVAVGVFGTLRSRIDDAAHRELLDHAIRDGSITVLCAAGAGLLAWRVRVAVTPLVVSLLLVAPGVLGQSAMLPVTDRHVVDDPATWVSPALTATPPVRVYRPIKLLEDVRDTSPPTLDGELATFSGASGSVWGIDAARSEDPGRLAVHDQVWFAAASAGGQLLTRYGIALAILPLGTLATSDEGTTMELGHRGSWALVRFSAAPPAAVFHEWIFASDLATELKRLFPPGSKTGLPSGLVVIHGTGRENQDEPSPPEPCTVERWEPGAIDLVCTAHEDSTGAYAVITSTPLPGWSATVDDHATPWLTADVLRRAVAISPGTHRVQWRYHAPGLMLALILAAIGILSLVALRVKKS